jgi:hypothetical protein
VAQSGDIQRATGALRGVMLDLIEAAEDRLRLVAKHSA